MLKNLKNMDFELLSKKIELFDSLSSPEAVSACEDALTVEINSLENEINSLKDVLVTLEMKSGLIESNESKDDCSVVTKEVAKPAAAEKSAQSKPKKEDAKKATNPSKKGDSKGASAAATNEALDISRLDFRVGKIVQVEKHPDADALYVEKVDVGEEAPRTIISGLVKWVPIEEMQNKVGVFLCNLKPAKMRGIESQGMLMCASAADTVGVEPLIIDSKTAKPGDRIVVPQYSGKPDSVLNPKKKIFEQIKPDLLVSDEGLAVYKGHKWIVEGDEGSIIKSNLKSVPIS